MPSSKQLLVEIEERHKRTYYRFTKDVKYYITLIEVTRILGKALNDYYAQGVQPISTLLVQELASCQWTTTITNEAISEMIERTLYYEVWPRCDKEKHVFVLVVFCRKMYAAILEQTWGAYGGDSDCYLDKDEDFASKTLSGEVVPKIKSAVMFSNHE